MKLSRRKFLTWPPAFIAAWLTRRLKPPAMVAAEPIEEGMTVPTAVPTAIGQEPPRRLIYLPLVSNDH